MTKSRNSFLGVFFALSLAAASVAQKREIVVTITTEGESSSAKAPFTGSRPAVDVALLLDTSNSMDGLISQAKNQLWTIVQQFAKAQKEGQTPILRVSLFEYGNTRLPATEGYIRQVVPLTDDLDELSEALFALTTSGGDEYCGQVIDEAITRLDWSGEPNAYQAIFIAGNEPFTQGGVDYHQSCRRAIESGIVVNTIHCGDRAAGISGQWKDGADLAEGKFFNIDQDRTIVHIDCPQDPIILRLNAEFNRTYLWFGTEGRRKELMRRQTEQDANARGEGMSTAASRVAAKASSLYRNVSRDLVDSFADDEAVLDQVAHEDLPAEMQAMNEVDRRAHIVELAKKRKELQAQIAELSKQRAAFVEEKRKQSAESPAEGTLGDAVVDAVREQLSASGFELDE